MKLPLPSFEGMPIDDIHLVICILAKAVDRGELSARRAARLCGVHVANLEELFADAGSTVKVDL